MFSDPDVIKASRKFICVRIESYESQENQKIVRSHLGGRFENTAFCVIAPDGEERLTRSGRGPQHISRDFEDIAAIADRYKSRGDILDSRIPDFNSFALALNVSSADQKILLLIEGNETEMATAGKRFRSIVWNKNVMGRFIPKFFQFFSILTRILGDKKKSLQSSLIQSSKRSFSCLVY